MVGIEAARIGQHPHSGCSERLRLEPNGRARPIERDAIGTNANYGDTPGTQTANLPGESQSARAQLIVRELRGCSCRARYEVGDADSSLEQELLFPRPEQALGEAGAVQGGPEAIARPGKVMPRSRGVETRIDAAEEDLQIGRDQIWHGAPVRSCQIGSAGALLVHALSLWLSQILRARFVGLFRHAIHGA
jgi:hypothetical protein